MVIQAICMVIVVIFVVRHYKRNHGQCESYIEERLYRALIRRGYNPKPQYRCGKYRIDLALRRYRLAIECDGKAYHSSPDQKKYDRRRTSYLRKHGWRCVLRFSGSEINKDVNKCVDQIEKHLKGLTM